VERAFNSSFPPLGWRELVLALLFGTLSTTLPQLDILGALFAHPRVDLSTVQLAEIVSIARLPHATLRAFGHGFIADFANATARALNRSLQPFTLCEGTLALCLSTLSTTSSQLDLPDAHLAHPRLDLSTV
jgi:hypothetical protein